MSTSRRTWSILRRGLRRYVTALGGTLHLVADFGDEQLTVS
ncbi:hypothetical protein [Promicromonospora sp. NPDC050880]